MTNCKKEFIEHIKDHAIMCACVEKSGYYHYEDDETVESDSKTSYLQIGFTENEYALFIDSLLWALYEKNMIAHGGKF